jgi:peptidoglycan hydrolase CwlO-like protein
MENKTVQEQIEWYETMISLHQKEINKRQNYIEEIESKRQKLNDEVLDTQRSMAPHYVEIDKIQELIELLKKS